MNTVLHNFVLRPSLWSDFHEEMQSRIPFDNPIAHHDYLFRRCASGKARIIDIYDGGEIKGFIVYEIHSEKSRELYVLAAYIEGVGVDWTDFLDAMTDDLARTFGCVSKSCSTNRSGLIKKLISKDFRISEVTLRKEVTS